jgi:hypothetical protein
MKTFITKTIAILVLTSTILACSKKDDTPTPVVANKVDYTVPITMSIDGDMQVSTIKVKTNLLEIGECETSIIGTTTAIPSMDFGITISNFNENGGTFTKPKNNSTLECSKMGLVAQSGTTNYYNKVSGGGEITLSGKTYTLNCFALKENDLNPGTYYTITATWTKP